MWRDAAQVYVFALQCGLKLILKGAFGLGLRFWIAPVVVLLLLIATVIVVAEGSAVAPFIYNMF